MAVALEGRPVLGDEHGGDRQREVVEHECRPIELFVFLGRITVLYESSFETRDAGYAAVIDDPHSIGKVSCRIRMQREVKSFDIALRNAELGPETYVPFVVRYVVLNDRRDGVVWYGDDVPALDVLGYVAGRTLQILL